MKKYNTVKFAQAQKKLATPTSSRACLIASGLGRMVDHMIGEGSWGIVSSHDSGSNLEWGETEGHGPISPENKKRNMQLRQLLQKKGIGYIKVTGAWLQEVSGIDKYVHEDSLFIPGINEELLIAIAKKYNQEAYIYGEGGMYYIKDTQSGAVEMSGSVQEHFKQWSGDENPDFYTGVQGRKWKFNPPSEPQMEEVQDDMTGTQQERVASIHILRDYGTVFYATFASSIHPRLHGFKQASELKTSGSSFNEVYLPVYEA